MASAMNAFRDAPVRMPSKPKPQRACLGGDARAVLEADRGAVGPGRVVLGPGGRAAGDPAARPVSKPVDSVDRAVLVICRVVEEDAEAGGREVLRVGDRDLDLLARVGHRSNSQSWKPPELPVAPFHLPVVPVVWCSPRRGRVGLVW